MAREQYSEGMPYNAFRPHKPANVRFWKHAFKNEPAFLIGNGPSAKDEDLSLIHERLTVGINRAYLLFDPAVLFWQDIQMWEQEKSSILRSSAARVCRDTADPHKRFYNFRHRCNEGFRLPDGPHVLYGAGATGPLAFQFAFALGCNPIVLIGFDCKYRDNKTDFYGVNGNHGNHTIPNCVKGLQWIYQTSQTMDRVVFNCSDNDVFPTRTKLIDVVVKLPPAKGRDYYVQKLDFLSRE